MRKRNAKSTPRHLFVSSWYSPSSLRACVKILSWRIFQPAASQNISSNLARYLNSLRSDINISYFQICKNISVRVRGQKENRHTEFISVSPEYSVIYFKTQFSFPFRKGIEGCYTNMHGRQSIFDSFCGMKQTRSTKTKRSEIWQPASKRLITYQGGRIQRTFLWSTLAKKGSKLDAS